MTDIVTRLRSSGADGDAVYMWNLCTEAADEIERLRAELKMMQDSAKDLIDVMRMPNIEEVADAHNAAVHLLKRTGHYGEAMKG